MKQLSLLLTLMLLIVTPAVLRASSDVPLRSGDVYQIRCAEWPTSCIGPSSLDPDGLSLVFNNKNDVWWRFTVEENGTIVLQHKESGRYLTFDGRRTAFLRYASLTRLNANKASRWTISVVQSGVTLSNVMHPSHRINVRRQSYIVGTYESYSATPGSNEVLLLVDKKGRVVNRIGTKMVNIPDGFADKDGKAQPLSLPEAMSKNGMLKRTIINNGPEPAYFRGMESLAALSNVSPMPGFASTQSVTSTVVGDITVDGVPAVFDKRSHRWLCSLSEKSLGRTLEVRFGDGSATTGTSVFVDGVRQPSNKCRFLKADGGHAYRVAMVGAEGDTVAAASICFTTLPIVELTASCLYGKSFVQGTFALYAPGSRTADTLAADVRRRGEYTLMYPKNSYSVKLKGTDGHKLDRSLCGLRSDNYWVLNAMANDHRRLTNRLAHDLWLAMATRPYYAVQTPKVMNGARGRMVEVFVDGKYMGIYDLSEHIDRKQLQLAKWTDGEAGGVLYKGKQWTRETRMTPSSSIGTPPSAVGSWCGWELRYPGRKMRSADAWKPLYEAVKLACTASDEEFSRRVEEHFDLDAVVDYMLLMEFTFAADNIGKNLYWAVGDTRRSPRLTPVPWDLDATFGQLWDGRFLNDHEASADYWTYQRDHWQGNGLFTRLSRWAARPSISAWPSATVSCARVRCRPTGC